MQDFHFFHFKCFLFTLPLIHLLVQIAHIQHSTDVMKKTFYVYRKNSMISHAVIVLYLYIFCNHSPSTRITLDGRTFCAFICSSARRRACSDA